MVPLRLPHRNMPHLCLLTLAITLLIRSATVSANYEHYCDSTAFRLQRNGRCGENLASAILSVCRVLSNSFMGKYIMKRMPTKGVDKRLHDITLNKKDAFSYLTKRQGSQNIVCECCVHRCGITEMYQYCELPPLSYKRATLGYANVYQNDESSAKPPDHNSKT